MNCSQCGETFAGTGDEIHCPFCGAYLPRGKAPKPEARTAWERRRSIFDPAAIFETIRAVLMEPSKTFGEMKSSGDMVSPLLFGLMLGTCGAIGGLFWHILTRQLGALGGLYGEIQPVMTPALTVVFMILSPLFVFIGLFISAGIFHLCLLVVGGARNGFETTFRAVAYPSGATALFQLLPFCGGFIGGIWGLVATIFAFRELHRISTGQAVAAALLPLCFGCCLAVVFGAGLAFLVVMMAGGAGFLFLTG